MPASLVSSLYTGGHPIAVSVTAGYDATPELRKLKLLSIPPIWPFSVLISPQIRLSACLTAVQLVLGVSDIRGRLHPEEVRLGVVHLSLVPDLLLLQAQSLALLQEEEVRTSGRKEETGSAGMMGGGSSKSSQTTHAIGSSGDAVHR
eukprot:76938-Rhodomonas_salina.4